MTVNPAEIRRIVEGLAEEVYNGGFDQYFFNSAGDDAAAAIEALKAIGAVKTAALLSDVCSRFPGGMPAPDRYLRQDDLLRGVSPDGEAFEGLDRAFYAYPDDLASLLTAYEARPGE